MKQHLIAYAFAISALLFQTPVTFADDQVNKDEWLAVKDTNLQIEQGSILDFSGLFGPSPKSGMSFIGVNDRGHLALDNGSGPRVRFLCAPMLFGGPFGPFPDHAAADDLAEQLRMRGYNLVRFHFIDTVLMEGRKKDFDYGPEALNRFHYLLAALKRQGIYWMIDAATNWGGVYAPSNPASKRNLRLDVHLHESAQKHWKRMVTTILGKKNPYTKLATLQDPALAILTLVNESGLEYLTKSGYQDDLLDPFRRWLLNKYGNASSIRRAWGDESITGIEQVTLPELKESSPRHTDLLRFFADLEVRTLRWATDFLRKEGYRGLITNYNNGRSVYSRVVEHELELVTQHGYYDHPSNFVRPGTKQAATSSISDEIPYARNFASSRYIGKPFLVDEYDHPFWNPWRREAGITIPAYAALQDWDGIARYATPVVLTYDKHAPKRYTAIYPFGVGMDPVARAGETLATLLFRRTDVQPAQSKINIEMTPQSVFNEGRGRWRPIPEDISTLAFITGIGLRWTGSEEVKKSPASGSDLTLALPSSPAGAIKTAVDKAAVKLGKKNTSPLMEKTALLKKSKIISTNNLTDPEKGIYHSDTGEILLETHERRMRVITPNTEAVVFDGGLPLKLNQLKIESASTPALVAVSSVDGHPLSDSKRILVILATDALNSKMRFSDDRTELYELGTLPVLMRAARVKITLEHEAADDMRLFSTTLNGNRMDAIPIEKSPGAVRFTLDTTQLSHGPTTYFELAAIPET
ncbi:MAG: beta-galactosidase [Pseudomonadota bacterium]